MQFDRPQYSPLSNQGNEYWFDPDGGVGIYRSSFLPVIRKFLAKSLLYLQPGVNCSVTKVKDLRWAVLKEKAILYG